MSEQNSVGESIEHKSESFELNDQQEQNEISKLDLKLKMKSVLRIKSEIREE